MEIKSIEDLLVKYMGLSVHFKQRANHVEETQVVPNADVEGAPATVAEAIQSLDSMAFVCDQIVEDILMLKFNLSSDEVDGTELKSLLMNMIDGSSDK